MDFSQGRCQDIPRFVKVVNVVRGKALHSSVSLLPSYSVWQRNRWWWSSLFSHLEHRDFAQSSSYPEYEKKDTHPSRGMNLLPGPHRHLEDSSVRYSGAQREAVKKQSIAGSVRERERQSEHSSARVTIRNISTTKLASAFSKHFPGFCKVVGARLGDPRSERARRNVVPAQFFVLRHCLRWF